MNRFVVFLGFIAIPLLTLHSFGWANCELIRSLDSISGEYCCLPGERVVRDCDDFTEEACETLEGQGTVNRCRIDRSPEHEKMKIDLATRFGGLLGLKKNGPNLQIAKILGR